MSRTYKCGNKWCVGNRAGGCVYGKKAKQCKHRSRSSPPTNVGDNFSIRYIHNVPDRKLQWMIDFYRKYKNKNFIVHQLLARKEKRRRQWLK